MCKDKKKVGICGHFGIGYDYFDGQTVKTKNVKKGLSDVFGDEQVLILDTHGGIKSLLKCLRGLIKFLKKCENIIFLPGRNSVKIFVPFLIFFNRIFHKKLHYIVIGGWLPEFIERKKILTLCLKKVDGIYVETNIMKKKLEEKGFLNVVIMPNFKNLEIINPCKLNKEYNKPYKLCTFSRVMKEKGIEDAINVVNEINRECGRIVYELDIYGQIDENYKERFENLQKEFPSFISYKGIVPFDKSVDVVKDYLLLLFPTYYKGEGLAGTLIDSFAAGVPVLATDWRYNSEIVKNGYNGYLFVTQEEFKKKLLEICDSIDMVINMKKNCLESAETYSMKKVIKDFAVHLE